MKREVKIGIFAVAMIGVVWAGIRFLKGVDIFSRNVEYYAAYDQINGVQNASPIMMKGVKIGSVTGLSFDPARSDKVVLRVHHQTRVPHSDRFGSQDFQQRADGRQGDRNHLRHGRHLPA